MKAEDILPDRQDRIRLGGVEIRKGSVGAFIANARLLLEEELPAAHVDVDHHDAGVQRFLHHR
ncbi:hypothetical protein ACLBUN_16055, partial [Pseudomonas aeruginosa]